MLLVSNRLSVVHGVLAQYGVGALLLSLFAVREIAVVVGNVLVRVLLSLELLV